MESRRSKHFSINLFLILLCLLNSCRSQSDSNYNCGFDCKLGEINSNVPAHFTQKSSLLYAKVGNGAKLICEAYGGKPITITWLKQQSNGDLAVLPLKDSLGKPISSHRLTRYASFEKDYSDANNKTIFELHLSGVETSDSGLYMCKAANKLGEDVRNIKLVVQDVPMAPQQVSVDQIWSRSISLRWSPPLSSGNSPILHYIVQYWRDNKTSNTAHRLYEETSSSTSTSMVLKDKLSPGTSYTLRVIATNEIGRGSPSSPSTFVTQEEEPEAPPIDIMVETVGTTALKIRWKAPPRNHWNGQLKGYNLGYRMIANLDEISNEAIALQENLYVYKDVPFLGVPQDNYQQDHTLEGLHRASTYSVVLRAHNSAGNGPLSHPIITTTSNNEPPLAPTIWVEGVTKQTILVKWKQTGNTHDITHYVLYYKDDRSPWLETTFPAPGENQYELTNLEPGVYYQIYMRCLSRRGHSDPSLVVGARTLGVALPREVSVERSHAGNDKVPPYFGSLVVLPMSAAVVIVVIISAIAYIYIKNEERKARILSAGLLSQNLSKNFQHLSTASSSPTGCHSIVSEESSLTLRYSDSSDRTKPLLARPPVPTILWAQQQGPILEENEDFPSPYATLPLQRLTTFCQPPTQRPPPPPSNPRRFSHECSPPPPPSSSSNVFCKADVHHNNDDGSDLYDFFKPHIV